MRMVKQPLPARTQLSWPSARMWWEWVKAHPAFATVGGIVIAFLLVPLPFAHKVHALLHGLCAQRLSHSFLLGGQALPFDARMTGIYGGFLITSCYLLALGRVRAWRNPSRLVVALLAVFVLVLAIDGTNSTLRDFGLWYAYQPDNRLRLATGLLTGISLAVLLCYLLASTLWKDGDWNRATIQSVPELGGLVLLQVPFALAAASGLGILYVPVSVLLVLAAIGVFVAVAVAMLTMARRRDQSYRSFGELQRPLAAALLVALAVIGSLAGGRYLLEWWLGIPPML